MITTIFLDMDGVVTGWWEQSLRMFGAVPPDRATNDRELSYMAHEHMNIDRRVLDDRINEGGTEWWANLPTYPWLHQLVDSVATLAPEVIFLSSSGRFEFAPTGKLQWLRKHFGPKFTGYVFTKHKHLCARSDRVLIDDSTKMVDKFTAAGGHGILFPQMWNARWREQQDPVSAVIADVKRLVGAPPENSKDDEILYLANPPKLSTDPPGPTGASIW